MGGGEEGDGFTGYTTTIHPMFFGVECVTAVGWSWEASLFAGITVCGQHPVTVTISVA